MTTKKTTKKTKRRRALSDAQVEVVVRLRREGHTLRQIGERFGVTAETISATLKRAEAEGVYVPEAMTGRPRTTTPKGPTKPKGKRPEAPPTVPDAIASLGGLDPADVGPQLLGVVGSEYLPALRRMARSALADDNLARMRDAMRLEIEVTKAVTGLVPPPPPDPNSDPLYKTAKARLIGKAKRIVERSSTTGDPKSP